jgi:iron complex transport system substrate-binding protein
MDAIARIAATIAEKRTVYFEVSPAPWMYSSGRGTYLHEIMELAGAVNIFGHRDGWMGVSEEILLELNPDVILTSTDFLPDPVGEIKGRPGFDALAAVRNNDIYLIDANASSRPTHRVLIAARQIARAVYPEYFK